MLKKLKPAEVPECDVTIIHQDVVDRALNIMPEPESIYDLAEFFKICGDQTRVKIMIALSEEEMCVCDITALLGMTHSAISHQLRVLKNVGLVKYEKRGKTVYYSLDDDHVKSIFSLALEHVDGCRRGDA